MTIIGGKQALKTPSRSGATALTIAGRLAAWALRGLGSLVGNFCPGATRTDSDDLLAVYWRNSR